VPILLDGDFFPDPKCLRRVLFCAFYLRQLFQRPPPFPSSSVLETVGLGRALFLPVLIRRGDSDLKDLIPRQPQEKLRDFFPFDLTLQIQKPCRAFSG